MDPKLAALMQRVADLLRRLRTGSAPPLPPAPPAGTAATPPEEEDVVTYPELYPLALAALAAVYVVVGGIMAIFGPTVSLFGDPTNSGLLVFAIGILHFAAGTKTIDANRIGGIFVLGWMTAEVSGQLICVPPGPLWLKDADVLTKDLEIPAEPENIWREETNPPANRPELRPPIRITFAEGPDKNDPLQRRVTQEVSFFVRLRVEKFFNFYRRIGTIEEARRQLEDVGVSYLAEVLPEHTLSDAIKKVKDYSEELKLRLIAATKGWGTRVVTARVKQFPFSRSLNQKIQAMAESTAEKRAKITAAEGEKEKLTLEGAGRASAVKSEIDARTKGMKNMSKALDIDGKLIFGGETARAIGQSPSTKTIVGLPGFRELVAVGTEIAQAAQSPKPEQSPQGGGP